MGPQDSRLFIKAPHMSLLWAILSLHPPIQPLSRSGLILSPIYAQVLQVVTFFFSPPKTQHAFLLFPICDTCPIHLTSLVLFTQIIQYLVKNTNNEAPHYAYFSSLLLTPTSMPKTFSSEPYSQITQAYFRPLIWAILQTWLWRVCNLC
jgi:hypothetical protein